MTFETAVVGGDDVTDHHLSGLEMCPETALVAICDPDESRARERAKAYDIAAYADFEGLLARESLDWLHLCTPPGTHLELVRMALEDDIPVQLTVPAATSVPEAEQLEQLVRDYDGRVSIARPRNFSPAMQSARDLLADGAVGEVRSVSLVSSGGGVSESTAPVALERGDRLLEPVSLLLHLAGYPDNTGSIQASTSGDSPQEQSETVQFHYRTDDGVRCSATVLPSDVPCQSIRIQGDAGGLVVDLVAQSVTELDQMGQQVSRSRTPTDRIHGRAHEVIDSLRNAVGRSSDDWESMRHRDGRYHQFHREINALEQGEPVPVPASEAAWVRRCIEAIRADTQPSPDDSTLRLGGDSA